MNFINIDFKNMTLGQQSFVVIIIIFIGGSLALNVLGASGVIHPVKSSVTLDCDTCQELAKKDEIKREFVTREKHDDSIRNIQIQLDNLTRSVQEFKDTQSKQNDKMDNKLDVIIHRLPK